MTARARRVVRELLARQPLNVPLGPDADGFLRNLTAGQPFAVEISHFEARQGPVFGERTLATVLRDGRVILGYNRFLA